MNTAARRICWPKPDATCLEGGCIHCSDEPARSFEEIERYARRVGVVRHRYGDQEVDALEALRYGRAWGW